MNARRELNLPKWAQEELQSLRLENERLKRALAAESYESKGPFSYRTDLCTPRVYIDTHFVDLETRGLKVSMIEANSDWEGVSIMFGTEVPGKRAVLLPQASNCIRIVAVTRD
jgi:hypothetical protein